MFTQKNLPGEPLKGVFEVPTLRKDFLLVLCMQKVSVTVFLMSGIKLQGYIEQFSDDCLILRKDGIVQILYQHAISSIMPVTPFTAPNFSTSSFMGSGPVT
ncbi:RNA chaperone Hfq [Holospora curviuscula]|uniref:RNA-binding protein Hfq n=1 Tax=Holospora curviuscula TaxID=1082868 RepID=A0A2S5R855_9PROT|nr:RNA chaperone Hfq [Holospora curviuscula]PPE03519.1 RNA-binding protein Hfq [Holospora curviuscula]